MHSFHYGSQLTTQLEGPSCLVSRKHPPKGVERPRDFLTLHQIVYKIIRASASREPYTRNLSGDRMFEFVKEALKRTFAVEPKDELVKSYYYSIRSHKNSMEALKDVEHGPVILTHYQKILEENLDWEDSMQMATWFLTNDKVSSLYQFPYQNIILVQPQLLLEKRNKNALEFFQSWCTWIEDYTRWNVFVVDEIGQITTLKHSVFESYSHLHLLEEQPLHHGCSFTF